MTVCVASKGKIEGVYPASEGEIGVEAKSIDMIATTILANAQIFNAVLGVSNSILKFCRTANLNVTCDVKDNDLAGL